MYPRIWNSHYDQMQGGMAILGVPWCDYLVYAIDEKRLYSNRIPFNQNHWNNILYPKLKGFLQKDLFPLIEHHYLT
jgi:hypothetical protein